MIKLSIIVPVYNAEKTIRDCVASIQSQKCHEIEIILVNDGSKDDSLDICKELAEGDDRIIVLDGKNAGVSVARNKGISIARGEYVAFVDADDSVDADIYTEMLGIAERNNVSIVFCNYREVNESRKDKEVDQITTFGAGIVKPVEVINKLIDISDSALFGVVWRSVFKRDIIVQNNIKFTPKLTMAEDLQFLLKYLKHTKQIGLCPKYLYHFRVSNQSTTGKYMKNQESDMCRVNDWMMEYVKTFDNNEDLIVSVEICMANTLILNIANICKSSTPYSLWGRIKYAYSLATEEKYRHALEVSMRYKDRIVKKRYNQMILMKHHMAFINVLFHSLKNHTLFT